MDNPYIDESMTEAYVYETEQIIESLEQLMIQSEKEGDFTLLVDVVLESIDCFKIELMKIKQKEPLDGEAKELLEIVDVLVSTMKNKTDKTQGFLSRKR